MGLEPAILGLLSQLLQQKPVERTYWLAEAEINVVSTTLPNMPEKKWGAGSGKYKAADGLFHIWGGKDPIYYKATHYAYDQTTSTWIRKADLPWAVQYTVGALGENDKPMTAGGRTSNSEGAYFAIYNPATDTWDTPQAFPYAAIGVGCETVQEQLHTTGGSAGTTWHTEWYKYDEGANTWTQVGNIPSARREHTFAYDPDTGKYYTGMGTSDGYNTLSDVYVYSGGSWTQLPDPPAAGKYVRSTVWRGQWVVVFGANLLIYDPTTNTWTQYSVPGRTTSSVDFDKEAVGLPVLRYGGYDSNTADQQWVVGIAAHTETGIKGIYFLQADSRASITITYLDYTQTYEVDENTGQQLLTYAVGPTVKVYTAPEQKVLFIFF